MFQIETLSHQKHFRNTLYINGLCNLVRIGTVLAYRGRGTRESLCVQGGEWQCDGMDPSGLSCGECDLCRLPSRVAGAGDLGGGGGIKGMEER